MCKSGLNLGAKSRLELQHIKRIENKVNASNFKLEVIRVCSSIDNGERRKAVADAIREIYFPNYLNEVSEMTANTKNYFEKVLAADYNIVMGPGGYSLEAPPME